MNDTNNFSAHPVPRSIAIVTVWGTRVVSTMLRVAERLGAPARWRKRMFDRRGRGRLSSNQLSRPACDLVVEREESQDWILEMAPSKYLAGTPEFLLDELPAVREQQGLDAALA